ncbi:MAG: FliI/YscN family ATPase [Nevskiales bacterium]
MKANIDTGYCAWQAERDKRLLSRLQGLSERLPRTRDYQVEGLLKRVVGLTLEASGCHIPIGGRCAVETAHGGELEAEVVGFAGDRSYLMATGDMRGLPPNLRVRPLSQGLQVPVGDALLGRVIDDEGRVLDNKPAPRLPDRVPLIAAPLNPMERASITEPLDVGVRAINSMLTIGRGQRMGLFAGSGVGKSTLLGRMTRYTSAEVIVVGLIGERGREVRDFIEKTLGPAGMRRAVVVAAPADRPPLARIHAAWRATAIAEYFRDRGRQVLLLMDSLTRFAHAQREIGLAVGEPPATRGYTPSVFARLPQLIERAGNGKDNGGSITGLYTVLVEGDDNNEPIADAARAILDGHIVLSRDIAESGLYPAIDIEASVSRVAKDIISPEQHNWTQSLRGLLGAHRSHRDLISIGAYQHGSDPQVDSAIRLWPQIEGLLKQDIHDGADYAGSIRQLGQLIKASQPKADAANQAAEPPPTETQVNAA